MDEFTKIQLLKEEYLHLQNIIERFNGRVITIKSWSISFSLTALGSAFVSHSSLVLLIASLSSLLFWIIEGYWKTFQYAYYDRIGKIEKFFEKGTKEIVPLQIGASWYKRWKSGGLKRLVKILFWPHVALPHVIIFFIGVIFYILNLFKIIKI